jgi:creatinine amidohydrolase/Fe(II)-dependent formamide hydrolase-like protein
MTLRHAGAAVLLAAAGFACAAPSSLRLEELTWVEVRDAIAAGKTTILVPIGGTEQNGPHMTLGKHNARAAFLAARIASQLGDALVAPTVAYVPEGSIDPPTGHLKYPGTIGIDAATFERTLESAARSFARAGFRTVVFLGDHGGYRASLDRVATKLDREWCGKAHVLPLPEYYRELPHAGRDDTALTLGLRDESLVRHGRIDAKAVGQGAAQDPTGATAEAGLALQQQIVDRSVAAIRKATAAK